MGRGRQNRRRTAKKLGRRTKEEETIVRALEAEDACIAQRYQKSSGSFPPRDPPVLGEPDAPVYAPLKPKPNLRSGAVAVPEPEPDEFSVAMPQPAGRDLP